MYTEKRVGPRIEPCGTPIETARDGQPPFVVPLTNIKNLTKEYFGTQSWPQLTVESYNNVIQ